MGGFIPDDICEQILVLLDANDLVRYRWVCKSWESLISHPRFVKAHHKLRQENLIPYPKATIPNYCHKYGPEYYMVGSSNGLACINSFDGDELIVANPWTGEERIILKPKVSDQSCWGFGYDSLTDDYKVVYGEVDYCYGEITFHVLSLKSNVWRRVGLMNYSSVLGDVQIGTLSNGLLLWAVEYGTTSRLVSFDLSKEVFKRILIPDDAILECSFWGINEHCRYIIRNDHHGKVWKKERRIVKQYWKYMADNDYRLSYDFAEAYTFIPATVMPSLISPYLQEGNE